MKLTEGMIMPDFTVNTSRRDGVSLKEIMGEKNIFWVIRYIGCTVCRYDVIVDVSFHLEKIYNTLEVYPAESREQLVGEDMDKLKAKGAAAREAGFAHGDYEGNELQLPALFITDKEGTVKYAHYGKNIVDMPTVDELIEML